MYLQISRAELIGGAYGPCIKITHLKLCTDDGKYVRFVRMDENTLKMLQSMIIPISDDLFYNPTNDGNLSKEDTKEEV